MAELTLVRCIGTDGWAPAVARWLREGSEHARAVDARPTAEALEGLARYVEQRDVEDPVLRTFYLAAVNCGWGTEGNDFRPTGEGVLAFRSMLGRMNQPTPEEALAELASVAVDDLVEHAGLTRAGLQSRTSQLEAEVNTLRDADERVAALIADNDRLASEVDGLNAQLRDARGQIDFLRNREPELAVDTPAEPAEAPTPPKPDAPRTPRKKTGAKA